MENLLASQKVQLLDLNEFSAFRGEAWTSNRGEMKSVRVSSQELNRLAVMFPYTLNETIFKHKRQSLKAHFFLK